MFAQLDRAYIARDLSRLLTRGSVGPAGEEKEEEGSEDDLPALIQAMPRVSKEENRLAKLQEVLEQLKEREEEFLKREAFVPRPPTHPQPAVVEKRLGQLLARLSDVRPAERQCLTDVTLSMFGPVWNDLTDQVSRESAGSGARTCEGRSWRVSAVP